MKKVLLASVFSFFVCLVLFSGCANFNPVSPEGGIIYREKGEIGVTFNLNTGNITATNKNGVRAEAEVLRHVRDVGDYVRIFYARLAAYPNGEVTKAADFGCGDEIKIRFKIDGQETELFDFFEIV